MSICPGLPGMGVGEAPGGGGVVDLKVVRPALGDIKRTARPRGPGDEGSIRPKDGDVHQPKHGPAHDPSVGYGKRIGHLRARTGKVRDGLRRLGLGETIRAKNKEPGQ